MDAGIDREQFDRMSQEQQMEFIKHQMMLEGLEEEEEEEEEGEYEEEEDVDVDISQRLQELQGAAGNSNQEANSSNKQQ
jgi:hypothetical protein